jgi:hypothetical protein
VDAQAREQRAAENEAAFRAANESLRRRFTDGDAEEEAPLEPLPFLCECANRECTAVIEIPLEVYEQVRDHPARFLIVPGHKQPSERIIDGDDAYHVIEKTGTAGETARALWHRAISHP